MPNNRWRTKKRVHYKRIKQTLPNDLFSSLKEIDKSCTKLTRKIHKLIASIQEDKELPFTSKEGKYEWCNFCENIDTCECEECSGRNGYQVQASFIDDCILCPMADSSGQCTISLRPHAEPPCVYWIGDEIIGEDYYDEL